MTRRKNWIEAFAVVRRDHFPGHEYDPDQSSPPLICGGEFSYTVKEVIVDLDAAIREVERLNNLAGPDTRYFCERTRLFTDGGSFGASGSGELP